MDGICKRLREQYEFVVNLQQVQHQMYFEVANKWLINCILLYYKI
jgi:hypothetical protein